MEVVKKNIKILIVDDNPRNLQVLGNLLHNLGYSCEFALNGPEAIKWLKKYDFDLVLLDLIMPEMDGYEVCRIIKSDDLTRHIPVIFITIKNDEYSIVKGFEAGAADYISKPFNNFELSARVNLQIELKKAHDELSQQYDELELKNKYIIESIECASLIQQNILTKPELISSLFQDNFLIYLPKDILSGDFYWLKKVDNIVVFGVFDCTGHGVPGALVSVIGNSALNEAVVSECITAHDIMNYLNSYFYRTFHIENEFIINEGMDLSLCVLNTSTNVLEFAGVNRNISIYKNQQLIRVDGYFADFGISEHFMTHYKTETIELEKGDMIYLYSDGFADQFNSINNKKFGSKRFESLLLANAELDMEKQKQLMMAELDTWKGTNLQTDDITLWGIKY
jgi:phosphoserine phosphatase RsbU/P